MLRWTAGAGEKTPGLVAGLDRGVVGHPVGETRRYKIPAEEGYGAQGNGVLLVPKNA
eukprot:gene13391-67_t